MLKFRAEIQGVTWVKGINAPHQPSEKKKRILNVQISSRLVYNYRERKN